MTHRLQYEGTKHGLQNVIMGIIKLLSDALLFLEESFYYVDIHNDYIVIVRLDYADKITVFFVYLLLKLNFNGYT